MYGPSEKEWLVALAVFVVAVVAITVSFMWILGWRP